MVMIMVIIMIIIMSFGKLVARHPVKCKVQAYAMVKKAVTAHLPQERLVVRRNHLHMSERGGVPIKLGYPFWGVPITRAIINWGLLQYWSFANVRRVLCGSPCIKLRVLGLGISQTPRHCHEKHCCPESPGLQSREIVRGQTWLQPIYIYRYICIYIYRYIHRKPRSFR